MINRGGEKISPREIDEALLRHPSVAEACCFGIPDRVYGEGVAAAVVLKDVPDFALVVGNPDRLIGWRCQCGNRIDFDRENGPGVCRVCRRLYQKVEDRVTPQ